MKSVKASYAALQKTTQIGIISVSETSHTTPNTSTTSKTTTTATKITKTEPKKGAYSIPLDLTIPMPEKIEAYGRTYYLLEGFDATAVPNYPMLLKKSYTIELPENAENIQINIVNSESQSFGIIDNMRIAEPPINLDYDFPEPEGIYPEQPYEAGQLTNFRQHEVIPITVYPLQYNTDTNELTFYSQISIEITYDVYRQTKNEVQPEKSFEKIAKTLIYNYDERNTPKPKPGLLPTTMGTGGSYGTLSMPEPAPNYLIITDSTLAPYFQPLVDWKIQKGVYTKIYDIDNILATTPGFDDAEKLRNFIQSKYNEYTCGADSCVEYVLLGGTYNIIPLRYARPMVYRTDWRDDIPTDFYYADFDYTWDDNSNSIYGEQPGDAVDLYPEVAVARAPVETPAEVQNFVNKILAYEKNPNGTDFINKIAFLAGYFDGSDTNDSCAKEQIYSNYIPSYVTPERRYESLGNLTKATGLDAISQSQFVNHQNHALEDKWCLIGNTACTGNININDIETLSNTGRGNIMYSVGCLSGRLDADNMGRRTINDVDGGAVAYIGASREAWYNNNCPTYKGINGRMDSEFYVSLFQDDIFNIGWTLQDSKLPFVLEARTQALPRWVYFEMNLQGDAEMPVWTNTPDTFIITHSPSVMKGIDLVDATVRDSTNNPVENATVTLYKEGEVYDARLTDSNGEVSFNVQVGTSSPILITVTKHNFLPYQDNISISGDTDLALWDETEPKGGDITKYITEPVKFWANFTDRSSGSPINAPGVFCEIKFDLGSWTTPVNMDYNSTSGLYEYERSFSQNGTFAWNVLCDAEVMMYEIIDMDDEVIINYQATQPPEITGTSVNIDEDTAPPANWIDLHDYTTDPDTNLADLTFAIQSQTNPSLIDCSISSNRYLECSMPAANQSGTNDVTVEASDGINADSDTFTITVNPINDAPVLSGIPDQTLGEDSGFHDNLVDLTAYTADADNTTFIYTITLQTGMSVVDCLVDGNYIDCTVQPGMLGSSDITVQADDGEFTDTDTFTINITEVNDPPVLDLISDITADEGDLITITANATDPDTPTLTYSINDSRFAQTDNEFAWQTGYLDAGVYTVNVSVTDGESTDSQEVQITINNVPVPDLKILKFYKQYPDNPNTTSQTSFGFIIINEGEADAVNFSWLLESGEGDSLTRTVPLLEIGKKLFLVETLSYTTAGIFDASATVDDTAILSELNESNNIQTMQVAVS
jgi:hypothetical protein